MPIGATASARPGRPTSSCSRDLFRFSRSFWFVVALCVTFYSAIFPFRSFAIKFFIESWEMTREAAGQFNSVLPLAAMIATPLFGLLVDKVGKRALFMVVGRFLLMPVYLLMAYHLAPVGCADRDDGHRLLADSSGDVAVGGLHRRGEAVWARPTR